MQNLITLIQKLFNSKKTTTTGSTVLENGRKIAAPKNIPHYDFNSEERQTVLLEKLAAFVDGKHPQNWEASRFIYRIGQLSIMEAAPLLMQLIEEDRGELKEEQFKYSFIRTLGRCKVKAARPWLKMVLATTNEKDFIKRIALDVYLQLLPTTAIEALQNKWKTSSLNADTLTDGKLLLLIEELFLEGSPIHWQKPDAVAYDLFLSYLISPFHKEFRTSLIEQLKRLPFRYPNFKGIRFVFKAAEARDDYEILGLLAYCFDSLGAAYKSVDRYTWDRNASKYVKVKRSEHKAFSDKTKAYFQKRIIRYLQTLGEEQVAGYCQFASELLQHYQEEESTPITDSVYSYRYINNRYHSFVNTFTIFSRLPLVWLTVDTKNQTEVQQIAASSRYRIKKEYYDKIKSQRSEPFQNLWDTHPQYACTLLQNCKSTYVGQFAIRILWGHEQEQTLVTKETLLQLFKSPINIVAEYALHHLERLMPKGEIDWELILAMVHSKQEIIHQALIERALNNKAVYFRHSLFLENLAMAQAPLMVKFFREYAGDFKWTKKTKSKIYRRLLKKMAAATNEAEALITQQNIQIHFGELLSTSSMKQAIRLLQHPLENCQLLGTYIILEQKEKIESLPEAIILNLLQSNFPSIAYRGMEIFGCLSVPALIEKKAIIISLSISEDPSMREAVKPVLAKIANGEVKEAQTLVHFFVPVLLKKETYEGLHQDILELLMNYLDSHLNSIPTKMVFQLENSQYREANILSSFLMEQIDFGKESLANIIRLANHEMLDIRQYCFTYFNNNIGRVRYESAEALRLLDAKWADSRQFGFDFFEKHFKAGDWTPELLVSVCDSTRTDVQEFGKKMIQRFFQEENGMDYLLQLSQHPSVALQLFATTYLNKYASNNSKRFIQLKPYFKTVLCQLQKGGAAKKKVFDFLARETRNNKMIAAHTIEILNEVILTIGIRDKARCIQILHSIKKAHPNLSSVLELKQVA